MAVDIGHDTEAQYDITRNSKPSKRIRFGVDRHQNSLNAQCQTCGAIFTAHLSAKRSDTVTTYVGRCAPCRQPYHVDATIVKLEDIGQFDDGAVEAL